MHFIISAAKRLYMEKKSQFVKQPLSPDQCVRSDALPVMDEINKTQKHTSCVTPPNKAGE